LNNKHRLEYIVFMNKKDVVSKIIEYLQLKIQEAEARVGKAAKSAADAPGSMESWSDKSKDEFTQLASALSKELGPLNNALKKMKELLNDASRSDKISVGSLVNIELPNAKSHLFIVPSGGGENITVGKDSIFLLSKDSELAKTILGHKVGDKVAWRNDLLTVLSVE